jgi:hypothetical protein
MERKWERRNLATSGARSNRREYNRLYMRLWRSEHPKQVQKKRCVECGQWYEPDKFNPSQQKFCSPTCNRRQKARRMRLLLFPLSRKIA